MRPSPAPAPPPPAAAPGGDGGGAEGQEPELATALYTNSDGAKYWSCPSCTFENALVRTNATASGQRVVCELCFRSAVLIPTP